MTGALTSSFAFLTCTFNSIRNAVRSVFTPRYSAVLRGTYSAVLSGTHSAALCGTLRYSLRGTQRYSLRGRPAGVAAHGLPQCNAQRRVQPMRSASLRLSCAQHYAFTQSTHGEYSLYPMVSSQSTRYGLAVASCVLSAWHFLRYLPERSESGGSRIAGCASKPTLRLQHCPLYSRPQCSRPQLLHRSIRRIVPHT